jgi:retron-type reverse transcriptase
MGQIAKRVEDKRLLKLIRAFLTAGVMENGLMSPSVEGTPQGGPLSPPLSNVVLDELDAGAEVSRIQFDGWTGGEARHCAESSGLVQEPGPGDYGTGRRASA